MSRHGMPTARRTGYRMRRDAAPTLRPNNYAPIWDHNDWFFFLRQFDMIAMEHTCQTCVVFVVSMGCHFKRLAK